jgi:GT2 family glycosyltransferase
MTDRGRLSFISATYNCLNFTKEFIKSLSATVCLDDHELIIVDDGSTDGTRDYLRALKLSNLTLILNDENQGFARNNNLGAERANHEILCFLNNDLELTPGWLDPMLDGLRKLPSVGAIGNIQLNPRTSLIDHAGIFFDLAGRPAHARKNRKKIPPKEYSEWNAVTAACMLIYKSQFDNLNGFDESYRNGSEDVDLCVRLRQLRLRNWVANRSIIRHHISASPGRHKYNDRNSQLFIRKWSGVTSQWGHDEWPSEYLARYARRWWRFNGTKLLLALFLSLKKKLKP